MKGSKLYMIFLFAFLVLVFLAEYMAPHQFSWKPTYDKNDKEPFGCYVFDDVLLSSIENYTVTDKTFYQIMQEDSAASPRAFLLMENHPYFNETDIEYLYRLVHLGHQIMICADNFPYTLEDTLCFETEYGEYISSFEYHVKKNKSRDSIFFGTDTLNPEYIFEVYPQMHPVSIVKGKQKWSYDEANHSAQLDTEVSPNNDETMNPDTTQTAGASCDETGIDPEDDPAPPETPDSGREPGNRLITDSVMLEESAKEENMTPGFEFIPINCDSTEVLVWNGENKPLAVRAFIGKGEIFMVSTPLMFTNYGMLDNNNASYIFRLLSYMKDKPLIRIEAYGIHDDQPRTPLRYILSVPPLRWAIYSIFILLILFTVFTAKRRQRIIPVVNAPPNRTFGFMQLISNLYYQKRDHGEILKMKHLYFCSEVKSLIGVDLQENVPDESDYRRLAEKTGMDKDLLGKLLKNIRLAIYRSEVDDLQLKQYIDGMNGILRALKT
ncbi:MAG: hypothetical protein LBG96_16545 [Tannerella sp.]|jgi:hypothetical protein|nr:hypothetical protein [Tannerella sp.]